MNDASGGKKDVYAIGKKNPNLPFYPAPFAPAIKDPDGNMISGTIEEEMRGTSRLFVEFSPQ